MWLPHRAGADISGATHDAAPHSTSRPAELVKCEPQTTSRLNEACAQLYCDCFHRDSVAITMSFFGNHARVPGQQAAPGFSTQADPFAFAGAGQDEEEEYAAYP